MSLSTGSNNVNTVQFPVPTHIPERGREMHWRGYIVLPRPIVLPNQCLVCLLSPKSSLLLVLTFPNGICWIWNPKVFHFSLKGINVDYHIYYLKYLRRLCSWYWRMIFHKALGSLNTGSYSDLEEECSFWSWEQPLKFTRFKGRSITWLGSFLKLERTLRYNNIITLFTAFYSAGTTLSSASTWLKLLLERSSSEEEGVSLPAFLEVIIFNLCCPFKMDTQELSKQTASRS